MNPYRLVLSPPAQQDLQSIYQFGLRIWGPNQSSAYLHDLKEYLWILTTQPIMGVERTELAVGMRSFPVKSHVVFYRVETNQVQIVRVLHGRQDPHRHIK